MKILFWVPPSTEIYSIRLTVYPPLSLLILASIAREKGHDVIFIDSENENQSGKEVMETISQCAPDIMAFSMPTPFVRIYNRYLALIREKLPRTIILTGGPHPSARGEYIFSDVPLIDYAVYGEGEEPFSKFLDALEGSRPIGEVPSLLYRKEDGEPTHTPPARLIQNLDDVPFPAYDLVSQNLSNYPGTFPSRATPSLHVMAMRGCPFHCTYCSNAVFGKSLRSRSPENVVNEVAYLVRTLGAREIFFQDDTLNCHPSYFLRLCDMLIQTGLSKEALFKVVFRANRRLVTPALLEKAACAGVWMIFYGVESGDPGMLRSIRKGISLEELKRAFLLTRQAGIKTHASLMIGNVGENRKTVENSIKLVCEILPDTFCFSIAYPFPGTKFFDETFRDGLMQLSNEFVDPGYPCIGISRTRRLSQENIVALKEEAQERCLSYLQSNEALEQIRKQYLAGGRSDLWERNRQYHEHPVLWSDVRIIASADLEEHPFLYDNLPACLELGGGEPLLGEGWLAPENWPPRLRHFGASARFYLPLPKCLPSTIVVIVYSGFPKIQEKPVTFRLMLWGQEIGFYKISESIWTKITCDIPDWAVSKPFLSIELSMLETWIPNDFFKNGDRRILGLAVNRIALETPEKPQ
jgi:radical SAM superfamily enzyme YgiQ (UPF0313 family)